jgi:hypothetical protein
MMMMGLHSLLAERCGLANFRPMVDTFEANFCPRPADLIRITNPLHRCIAAVDSAGHVPGSQLVFVTVVGSDGADSAFYYSKVHPQIHPFVVLRGDLPSQQEVKSEDVLKSFANDGKTFCGRHSDGLGGFSSTAIRQAGSDAQLLLPAIGIPSLAFWYASKGFGICL